MTAYEDVKCPECNGEMISRTGKFGVFWGCRLYPYCKGTRDSEGRSKADREREKQLKDPHYDGSDLVDEERLADGTKTSFKKNVK